MLNTPSIPLLDLTSLPKDGSGEETTFASESQHKSRDTWQKAGYQPNDDLSHRSARSNSARPHHFSFEKVDTRRGGSARASGSSTRPPPLGQSSPRSLRFNPGKEHHYRSPSPIALNTPGCPSSSRNTHRSQDEQGHTYEEYKALGNIHGAQELKAKSDEINRQSARSGQASDADPSRSRSPTNVSQNNASPPTIPGSQEIPVDSELGARSSAANPTPHSTPPTLSQICERGSAAIQTPATDSKSSALASVPASPFAFMPIQSTDPVPSRRTKRRERSLTHSVASSASGRYSTMSIRDACAHRTEQCGRNGEAICPGCHPKTVVCRYCSFVCKQCMVSSLCENCLPQKAHNCLDLGRQAQQKELAEQQEEMAELKRLLAKQQVEQQRLSDEHAQKERITAQSARRREASIELASQERVRTAAAQADALVSETRREMHGVQQHELAVRTAAENTQKLMTAELHSAQSKENDAYRQATSLEEIARIKDLQYQKDMEATRLASEQRSALALADVTAAAELRSTQIVTERTQALETRAAESVKEIELRSAQTIADNAQAADKRASEVIAEVKAQTEVELRSAQITLANSAAHNKMLLAATETASETQAAEQASQFYSQQIKDAQSQAHNLRTQIGHLETASTHAVRERDQANASLQAERANTAHKAREIQQEMTRIDTSHQTEVTTLQSRILSQHAQMEHASEESQRATERQRRTEAELRLRPAHGDDTCFACTQPRRHDCSQCANGCCTSHFAILSFLCLICQQRQRLDADAAANEKRRQQKFQEECDRAKREEEDRNRAKREEDSERTRREAQWERETALALAELDRSRREALEAQVELERAKKALAIRDQEHEEMLLKLRQDRDRDLSHVQSNFEAYRNATSAVAAPTLAHSEHLTRSPGVSAPLSGAAPTASLTLSPSDHREQPELSSGSQQDPTPNIPPFPIGHSEPPKTPDPPRSPGSPGGTPGGPSGNPGGGGGGGGPPGGPGGNPGGGGGGGGPPGSPGGGPTPPHDQPPGGPGGNQGGGGGGDDDGDDDGGPGATAAGHAAHHPQGGFSGHYAYINLKPLEPLPADTNELKYWTDLTIRQVASSSTDPEPCLLWIREAFNQAIPEDTLIKWEPFQRLDLAIAGDIKAKILKLRKQTGLPPFRHSMLAEIDRREHEASLVPRLLRGREMIRIAVKWVSFRNEILEGFNYLDLLNIKINAKNPNQDLFAFHDEWIGKFQAVFRGAPPTFESDPKLYSSIHKHYHSQVSLAPMLKPTLIHYDLSEDPLYTGIRTYEWLVKQVARHLETSRAKHMEKTHHNDNRLTHDSAPAPGGGGRGKGPKGQPGRGGKGNDKSAATSLTTKNGTLKKDILCRYAAKGVACPDKNKPGGCLFNHDKRGHDAKKAKVNAAPAPDRSRSKDRDKGRDKGNRPRSDSKGRGKGRDQSRDRSDSKGRGKGRDRSGSAERQKTQWCFAYSRGDCKGANATPPCTRLHPKGPFPAEAIRLRDRYEAGMKAAGKPLPYKITDRQLAAAVEAAAAASSAPPPPKAAHTFTGPCKNFTADGKCRFGKTCNWFGTTPNHPQ